MNEFGQNVGKLILRLTVGGLLLFHGVSKMVHGISWMAGPLHAYHLPFFVAYGVYVGEVVAPVLIILGVWARAAGLVISFDLFTAFILVDHVRLFEVGRSGGWSLELQAFYFLTGLAVFLFGAGKLSVGGSGGKWN